MASNEAAVRPRTRALAQAQAQQAVGDVGPLFFVGRFFVGVAAGDDAGQIGGVGRVGVLNLEVVHRVQRLVLLVGAGHFFGFAEHAPGQARNAGLEQVLGQGELPAHRGGGRGVELALAQQQEIGEVAQQALAQRVVGHGVGRGRVKPGDELGGGQFDGLREQGEELRVEAAYGFAALPQDEHGQVAPVVGAQGQQGGAQVVHWVKCRAVRPAVEPRR